MVWFLRLSGLQMTKQRWHNLRRCEPVVQHRPDIAASSVPSAFGYRPPSSLTSGKTSPVELDNHAVIFREPLGTTDNEAVALRSRNASTSTRVLRSQIKPRVLTRPGHRALSDGRER